MTASQPTPDLVKRLREFSDPRIQWGAITIASAAAIIPVAADAIERLQRQLYDSEQARLGSSASYRVIIGMAADLLNGKNADDVHHGDYWGDIHDQIVAVMCELTETMREDAERYRQMKKAVEWGDDGLLMEILMEKNADEWDAAIDAARSEGEQT